jgi:hypothetical protein
LRFTSDFAGLSNFIRLTGTSNVINGRAGSGFFPKFTPLIPSKTPLTRNDAEQTLSLAVIIGICAAVVAVLMVFLSCLLLCLCKPPKHDIGTFDGDIVEPHADVRVQSLVDFESHSQSDDAFAKTPDGGSSPL